MEIDLTNTPLGKFIAICFVMLGIYLMFCALIVSIDPIETTGTILSPACYNESPFNILSDCKELQAKYSKGDIWHSTSSIDGPVHIKFTDTTGKEFQFNDFTSPIQHEVSLPLNQMRVVYNRQHPTFANVDSAISRVVLPAALFVMGVLGIFKNKLGRTAAAAK